MKGLERATCCVWKLRGNSGSRQKRLYAKICNKRKRKSYHNKGVNSSRINNNHKYICTNIGACKYIKEILTDLKGEMHKNKIVGDFKPSLSTMNRSFRQKINKKM